MPCPLDQPLLRTVDCHDLLSSTSTIDDLPEGILLEIFDTFRLEFKADSPTYYKLHWGEWGWFRVAHWRSIVLASPSRLDLHLLFSRSSQSLLTCPWLSPTSLSSLPIFVWCVLIIHDDAPLVAAMKYPDRLHRINIAGTVMG